jgi:hypothetical protein
MLCPQESGGPFVGERTMETTGTRQAIADYLHQTADWRRRKAEEYDRDARNLRCAAGLEELADYVLALPEPDERIGALSRLAMTGEVFTPGQQTSYEIGRFRFHSDAATCDAFLGRLVELASVDANEHGRFGGLMAPGDDPWG